jgi:histidinol dehydrogenase
MLDLRLIDLRGDRTDPSARLPRASEGTVDEVRAAVRDIVAAVRGEGHAAVARFTATFDGYDGSAGWEVGQDELREALDALAPPLRSALERAAGQVRWFHERARPADWLEEHEGALLGVRHQPLRRVGVYVPGGRAAYPSTVLMTVVPARVAGVEEVVLCTPPGPQGRPDPTILAAAALAGADRVLRIGGAQAVAAMAFGTEVVPRCDKVVGPGNSYVAEAKLAVSSAGACGIDTLAGVTEVAIIADGTADPVHVATDMVAQAEHDPLATALLITPDEALVRRVGEALRLEVGATRHAERVRAALGGQGAAVLVDDLEHAVEVADAFAAEHLEVQTADAVAVAERVRRAGAIFVGAHSPVSLGDYCAGPNHTLPTGGTARFAGGLRTDDFLVPVNWVQYSPGGLAALAPVVDALAEAEDLPAHARAVRARLDVAVAPGAPEETPARRRWQR